MKRLCIILVGVMFFVASCEKTERVQVDEPLSIESAKEWFENTIGSRKARTTGNEDVKNALWEKAEYRDFGFGKVVVIPIKYEKPTYPSLSNDGEPKQSKYNFSTNDLNYLVVSKDDSFKAMVAKLIPTEKYLEKSNGRKKKVEYEGLFILEDWNGGFVNGLVYKNGKATSKLADSKKVRSTTDWECWTHTQWSCASGDGQSWACSEMYSYTYCSGGPANEDQWSDPDYSGGGGSGGPNPGNNNGVAIITDNLTNPCFSSVLSNLQSNNTMSNSVLTILNNFATSTNINITFQNSSLGGCSLDGTYSGRTVTLNSDALQNASKEYVAATILHEVIHAELSFKGISINGYTDHNLMANSYINPMASALQASFTNLSWGDATALAWGGLQGSQMWFLQSNLSPGWANDVLLTNDKYRNCNNQYNANTRKGTPC